MIDELRSNAATQSTPSQHAPPLDGGSAATTNLTAFLRTGELAENCTEAVITGAEWTSSPPLPNDRIEENEIRQETKKVEPDFWKEADESFYRGSAHGVRKG